MDKYICIHGHFYQPPRENAWLEAVELQDSAYPYHDWNERITAECYTTMATSRLLDEAGRIRVDDWEMAPDVQKLVDDRWKIVTTENFSELGDFEGYQSSFLRLFGFGLEGVDYNADVDVGIGIPSVPSAG